MRNFGFNIVACLMVSMIATYVVADGDGPPGEPRAVAAAYLTALQESDLIGAGKLFA